jgi:hypothetical protein
MKINSLFIDLSSLSQPTTGGQRCTTPRFDDMWHITLERPDFMLRWQNIGLDLLVMRRDRAGQGFPE